MNGAIDFRKKIGDAFVPSARANGLNSAIVVTTIAEGVEVVTYSADEARRYIAAFAKAVLLHEEAERPQPGSDLDDMGDDPTDALVPDAAQPSDLPARSVLDEPVKPCGCLSFGEDCDKCRTDPIVPDEAQPSDLPDGTDLSGLAVNHVSCTIGRRGGIVDPKTGRIMATGLLSRLLEDQPGGVR